MSLFSHGRPCPSIFTQGLALVLMVTATLSLSAANTAPSFALPSGPLGQAGASWTTDQGFLLWGGGIASSADGTKLVATRITGASQEPSGVSTSTDSGLTWISRQDSGIWNGIVSSTDGTKLAAIKDYEKVYTSTDSGVTWTRREASPGLARMASSADGTTLFGLLGENVAPLYISKDSGATWMPVGTKRPWNGVAVSADGTKLAAVTYNGQIYISGDAGVTWTARAMTNFWHSISMSADGSKLAATTYSSGLAGNGAIYTSTDFGVTWTPRTEELGWTFIVSSSDGTRLAAYNDNGQTIYTSGDSGATWTISTSIYSNGLATSADGGRLFSAAGYFSYSVGAAQPYVLKVTATSGAYTAEGFASNILPGPQEDEGQTVDFSVSNDNNGLFTVQPSISPGGTLSFTPGSSTGTALVTVMAQDDGGTADGGVDTSVAQTFTIQVLPISNDATLSSIGLSSGTLSPSFLASTLAYQVTVGSAVSSLTVTPAVNQVNATTQVKVNAGGFGSAATPLALNVGANTVTIQVTAQDGSTTQNYTLAVTRLPMESVLPTVTLITPAAKAKVNEDELTVTGAAADNAGLEEVEVRLNNEDYFPAQMTLATNGLSATYTATFENSFPRSGINTLYVRSRDINGNYSKVLSRTFTYIVLRPLTVNLEGPEDAEDFATLTAPFPGTDEGRTVGTIYTLTATPKAGFLFNGWSTSDTLGTGITEAKSQLPKLTFVMQDGLELTARFIANPFTADVTGSYAGLISNAEAPGVTNTGYVSATVAANSGAFSASVKINGRTYGVAGKLDNTGQARFGSKRATSFTLINADKTSYTLQLQLDLTDPEEPHFRGQLTRNLVRNTAVSTSLIDMAYCPYSTSNKVAAEIAGTGKQQAYTLRFPVATPPEGYGFTEQDYPQGDGYATLQITPTGTVTLSGKLADGAVVTFSGRLDQSDSVALSIPLYSGTGCLNGQATVDLGQPDTDIAGAGLLWFRPFQLVQWYPFGWEEGLSLDLQGAKFTAPTATDPLFIDLGEQDEGLGNATLTLSRGQLLDDMEISLNLIASAKAVKAVPVPATDLRASLTFTSATGLVSGKFTHDDETSTPLQGVVMQKGANKGAFGYFQTNSPKPVDYTGETGRMVILAKPILSETP